MKSKEKKEKIFHAPLKPKDTATQTGVNRHSNPDICGNNSLFNVCAFVTPIGMCMKPPHSWPKQFKRLKEPS